jgi:hypothetical protein
MTPQTHAGGFRLRPTHRPEPMPGPGPEAGVSQ